MHGADLIKRALTQRVSVRSVHHSGNQGTPQSKGGKSTVHIHLYPVIIIHYTYLRINPLYLSMIYLHIYNIYIYVYIYIYIYIYRISTIQGGAGFLPPRCWSSEATFASVVSCSPTVSATFSPGLSSVEFGDWNQHWAVGKKMLDNLLWVLKRIHHFDLFWKYVRYLLAFFTSEWFNG